jgi:hypothetical protein
MGAMPTLAVGMSLFLRVPVHAHDKRGHGTQQWHAAISRMNCETT